MGTYLSFMYPCIPCHNVPGFAGSSHRFVSLRWLFASLVAYHATGAERRVAVRQACYVRLDSRDQKDHIKDKPGAD